MSFGQASVSWVASSSAWIFAACLGSGFHAEICLIYNGFLWKISQRFLNVRVHSLFVTCSRRLSKIRTPDARASLHNTYTHSRVFRHRNEPQHSNSQRPEAPGTLLEEHGNQWAPHAPPAHNGEHRTHRCSHDGFLVESRDFRFVPRRLPPISPSPSSARPTPRRPQNFRLGKAASSPWSSTVHCSAALAMVRSKRSKTRFPN